MHVTILRMRNNYDTVFHSSITSLSKNENQLVTFFPLCEATFFFSKFIFGLYYMSFLSLPPAARTRFCFPFFFLSFFVCFFLPSHTHKDASNHSLYFSTSISFSLSMKLPNPWLHINYSCPGVTHFTNEQKQRDAETGLSAYRYCVSHVRQKKMSLSEKNIILLVPFC